MLPSLSSACTLGNGAGAKSARHTCLGRVGAVVELGHSTGVVVSRLMLERVVVAMVLLVLFLESLGRRCY
jgi:hypothetical protein